MGLEHSMVGMASDLGRDSGNEVCIVFPGVDFTVDQCWNGWPRRQDTDP